MYKLRLAGLINDSITDGAGLRLTVFAQGCHRRCEGCHNPTAQPFEGGKVYTVDEIVEKVKANPLLSGVTFSGGEPFEQAEAYTALAKEVKKLGLNVCVFSGYTFEVLITKPEWLALLEQADILIDGEFILAERNILLKFRGSANQRILDVPKSLAQGKAIWSTSPKWV
ncbi:MAG: 4Fe-4S single cluster domain-containing protein [Clostridia bacterium]